MTKPAMVFNDHYQTLLCQLLEINSVTPMETGQLSSLKEANAVFAKAATELGFEQIAEVTGHDNPSLPLAVRRKAHIAGADFFNNQPSIALGLGAWQHRENTLMFNFHMDTVGPLLPVQQTGDTLRGRGVIDNKGPGVAVLAAIAQWLQTGNKTDIGIIIQVVGGEEGGAMGTYGTRLLFEQQYYGALNLFVIPSEGRYFDCSTTSMTVEVTVDGQGATDDSPWAAHNSTVILSAIATSLSKTLAPALDEQNVKMTVAGLHTGDMHNRVYGQGRLLLNFAYRSTQDSRIVEQLFAGAFEQAQSSFCDDFAGLKLFERSVTQLSDVLSFQWLKKDLPVLNNRSPKFEVLLQKAGIQRHQDSERTFTCDAMWGQQDDGYSILFGPGSLEHNGAHTAEEQISLPVLESYSHSILHLLHCFSDAQTHGHSGTHSPTTATV